MHSKQKLAMKKSEIYFQYIFNFASLKTLSGQWDKNLNRGKKSAVSMVLLLISTYISEMTHFNFLYSCTNLFDGGDFVTSRQDFHLIEFVLHLFFWRSCTKKSFGVRCIVLSPL